MTEPRPLYVMRDYRKKAGFTFGKLENLTHIKRENLNRIERGRRKARPATLQKIADALAGSSKITDGPDLIFNRLASDQGSTGLHGPEVFDLTRIDIDHSNAVYDRLNRPERDRPGTVAEIPKLILDNQELDQNERQALALFVQEIRVDRYNLKHGLDPTAFPLDQLSAAIGAGYFAPTMKQKQVSRRRILEAFGLLKRHPEDPLYNGTERVHNPVGNSQKAEKTMTHLTYNSESQRYVNGNTELHAGFQITVINADGSKTDTRIEHDDRGWYLVGIDNRNLEQLTVEPY